MVRAAADPIPLPGVPEGLEARPVVRLRAGEPGEAVEVRDRRGRRKTDRVVLAAAQATADPAQVAAGLDDGERRFLLGTATRAWGTVAARYGDAAWDSAVGLARLGAVTIECPVDDGLRLCAPTRWRLTEPWRKHRAHALAERADETEAGRARATAAADAVQSVCPELAGALQKPGRAAASLRVLVCAAEDLAAGIRHDGARAFSQTHFADSKARDDVAAVLADAGVPRWVAEGLGVSRAARIGLGGPITVHASGGAVRLAGVRGPVLFRTDQPGLEAELAGAAPLVVVENLQAAEAVCDRWSDVAVAYTAGQPGDAALRLLGLLGDQAKAVAVVPDADLGGVRIAERVLRAVPHADVVDVGDQPHAPTTPWVADGTAIAGLRAALDGLAGGLAAGCLERGYPVEQEAVVMGAVAEWLGSNPEPGPTR